MTSQRKPTTLHRHMGERASMPLPNLSNPMKKRIE